MPCLPAVPRFTVVLAGGGERVTAWEVGVLAGLADAEQEVVDRLARRLPSGAWPVGLRIVAVDAQDGERVALDAGSDVPLARAVAASCAIPTLLPPITVGGRLCVDGALGSATNADLVAGSDASVVLVITATSADPPAAGPDRLWLAALREELAALEAAGHHVVLAQAGTADLDAMGADPMSPASAPRAVAAGRARGRELVAARPLGRAA